MQTAFGDKVRALTIEALHRPLLVTVLILGFVVASAVAPVYLIPAALIGVGGTIGLVFLLHAVTFFQRSINTAIFRPTPTD